MKPRHRYQHQGRLGQRLGEGQAQGWARVWTEGMVGGWGRGQRSGLEPGHRCVYSQHSHIEGVGDVGGSGQMPAAVEALGISVGAAAEYGLPRRHWG